MPNDDLVTGFPANAGFIEELGLGIGQEDWPELVPFVTALRHAARAVRSLELDMLDPEE